MPDSQNSGVESVFRKNCMKSLLMAESKLVVRENMSKKTNMSTMATGSCKRYKSSGWPQMKWIASSATTRPI